MGRWEPNAHGRLAAAALELYSERGYEQTTVAEIARRAGLTERTFFRHYADKREVLFATSGEFQELFVRAVAGALKSAAPIDALAVGLDAVSEMLTDQRDCVRTRQAVIMANPELQERDLIKLTSMSAALADTLRRHGVTEPAASLAAEAGVAVFKVGFERWVAGDEERELSRLMRESLDELKAVTAGR
ncbi:TetR/AcrR family transcriptional regulator [Streptomyces olivochromogenes]|uniref:TetR family transcriptional regulator n=1 Tax=Streptomyces olivochromogenes TaxID=1963 RepID=A0A250VEE8_STROL|nr:TetR/AcrR family transcriptional regulator [Streptomyces olivochromogenes]KUN46895.1 TetR family transcriptional regulator [Streptomyces olivochromogenes]GAX52380.1 TetR family transcriptional regulator [Streptomyces olivochromogenes]